MEKKVMSVAHIWVVKDIYEGAKTSVKTSVGDIEDFSINIELHQGPTLGQFIFTIVIDELTKDIQNEVSWYMLFTDDIVLIDKTKNRFNSKLEQWRHVLELGKLDWAG